MVHLQHVQDEFKKDGVVVLGFNTADSKEKVVELMRQKGATFPTILDGSRAVQAVATNRYRSSSVPMNYIIDREGRIAAAFSGYRKGDERGVQAIREILAGRSPAALREKKSVHGRVLALGGKPLNGARIILTPASGRGSYGATTDADGDYAVEDVPAGEYRMLIILLGKLGFSAPGGTVTAAADRAVRHDVRLPDGTIEGRIVNKVTGKPFDPRDIRVSASPNYYSATPDENGRYRLVGLPPGTYRVRVSSPLASIPGDSREIEVAGNKKGVDFAIATVKTGKLRLRVDDAQGKPARDLQFRLELSATTTQSLYGRVIEPGLYEFDLAVGERAIGIRGQTEVIRVDIAEGETVERKVQLP
jgi:hypothetical protein